MISTGNASASRIASSVLPEAVGPISVTMTSFRMRHVAAGGYRPRRNR